MAVFPLVQCCTFERNNFERSKNGKDKQSQHSITSPVHGLYKIDKIKSFADTVSRRFPTSAINVTQLYPPRRTIGAINSLYVKIHEF